VSRARKVVCSLTVCYSVSEQMSATNKKEWQKEHFRTNKTPNEITVCLQRNTQVPWLKIEVFYDYKVESALAGTNHSVNDRSLKSGSIQECPSTELASGVVVGSLDSSCQLLTLIGHSFTFIRIDTCHIDEEDC